MPDEREIGRSGDSSIIGAIGVGVVIGCSLLLVELYVLVHFVVKFW